ncbi:MAG TPA: hypothetical protein PKA58_36570, partial [Polyangium sp.]|nr:hypothetical protein [Polyangium sp.]
MKRSIGQRTYWVAGTWLLLAGLTMTQGVSCGGDPVTPGQTGGAGGTGTAGQGGEAGGFVGPGSGSGGFTGTCMPVCDNATQVCSHGVCVPLGGCTSDAQCKNDTYCDP